MESTILYLIPALGIFGLVVMAGSIGMGQQQADGEENMVELATYNANGAMAFLKAEWTNFSLFCSRRGISSRVVWDVS
jgi:K(+)-stimulated pyrophosphate-energized sodium pump